MGAGNGAASGRDILLRFGRVRTSEVVTLAEGKEMHDIIKVVVR